MDRRVPLEVDQIWSDRSTSPWTDVRVQKVGSYYVKSRPCETTTGKFIKGTRGQWLNQVTFRERYDYSGRYVGEGKDS